MAEMSLGDLLLLGLATWRLTSLLVNEDGPFDLFVKLRWLLGVRFDEQSQRQGTNMLAKGLLCIWCTSIWVAAGWAGLFTIATEASRLLALPLALSAAAIVVERLVDGNS